MISTSDIEEPTWPRSPPCSVRTASRRRYFERSSSGGVARLSTGAAWAAISLSLHLVRQRGEERARMGELPGFHLAPAAGFAGEHAALPALGNELVEQDQHPAQAEQRQIGRQPGGKCRVAAIEPGRCLPEPPALLRRQRPARVQQNI